MKKGLGRAGIVGVLCVGPLLCGSHLCFVTSSPPAPVERPTVTFNEDLIRGVYSRLNTTNAMSIFDLVFSSLHDEVVVYPTENYYYFTIYANGKTISGNLRLAAEDRDLGLLQMGYFEYDENGTYEDTHGVGKTLSLKDGVSVQRISPFLYSVAYRGRTVRFHLNNVGSEAPRKARLRKNEVFVGPIFDESGLKFFLLFNRVQKNFMYILNEEGVVPERFVSVRKDVLIGRRTGFAFFADTANARKILIGAHGRSVERNNYYDGPFDQLPDNYVERSHIRTYIEQAYPFTRGKIDRYGIYTQDKSGRALLWCYLMYYDVKEVIRLVDAARRARLTKDQFYAAITPDVSR